MSQETIDSKIKVEEIAVAPDQSSCLMALGGYL
jgi:hypothetical protein